MDENRIKTGLTEGAGREESRINQDFIDFLSKWSTPFLILLAVLAVGYWGWNQWQAMKVAKVNDAIAQYVSAIGSGNPRPDQLEKVAREFEGVRSIGLLAKLDAADLHLQAVQRGLEPGVQYLGEGSLGVGDTLDEDRRRVHLGRAEALYKEVLASARSVAGKESLALEAAFGLAAVAETNGQADAARGYLADARALADKAGFATLAAAAERRAENLSDGPPPKLYDAASLPELPTPAPPPPPETPVTTPTTILENPPLFPDAPETPSTDDGVDAPADDGVVAPADDGVVAPADEDEDDGG